LTPWQVLDTLKRYSKNNSTEEIEMRKAQFQLRKSLCNPEFVESCKGGHSSLNCYVRYTDLGFEPGETFLTLDEWMQD
jgi:hypothetical protein